jgi:hypothetical protein
VKDGGRGSKEALMVGVGAGTGEEESWGFGGGVEEEGGEMGMESRLPDGWEVFVDDETGGSGGGSLLCV